MKLVVLDGPQRGSVTELDQNSYIVGRKREADVCLKGDGLISRYHCQLTKEEDGWHLEDLGSGNGTFLDGELVDEARNVGPGHLIRVGGTRIAVVQDDVPLEEVLSRADSASLPGGSRRSETWSRQQDSVEGPQVRVVEEGGGGRQIAIDETYDPRDARALPQGLDEQTVHALRTRLAVFQDVAEAVAGKLDQQQLYEAVLDAVLSVVTAQRGFVLRVDEREKKIKAAVVRTTGRERELVLSRTLLGKAVRERMALLVHDAQSDENLSVADSIKISDIRSAIAVPMVDQDRVVALLYLDTSRIGSFTTQDLELVSAVANQAALAVANARLYSELRKAYEDLENAQDSMIQNEKLSIIGTLAASIAHDIGNVLTPISGISKIVMRNPEIDDKLKVAFGRQMQRLKALTQQLLSFSKPTPPELVPTDVNSQVEDTLKLVQTELRHDEVKIVRELGENLPQVGADSSRLDQVLINLSINASHAMEKDGGGTLTVRTRAEGDDVLIEIADTGCGIPPEKLRVIFEPFFSTKGKKGTGLGLFSAKRIVEEEHHGKLEVASRVGEGTTFTLRLPALR